MKVVLLEDVEKLGNKGDIVDVKTGYGQNFLIKKKLALLGTKENIETAIKAREEEARRQVGKKEDGEKLAEEINKTEINFCEKVGDDGQLFGSVTSKDIAEKLEAETGIKIDKRKIELDTPIRNVGRIEVKVKTFPGVTGDLTIIVKGEE